MRVVLINLLKIEKREGFNLNFVRFLYVLFDNIKRSCKEMIKTFSELEIKTYSIRFCDFENNSKKFNL